MTVADTAVAHTPTTTDAGELLATDARILELETICPPAWTGSGTPKGISDAPQNWRGVSTLPDRLWPKIKFGPSTMALASSRPRIT